MENFPDPQSGHDFLTRGNAAEVFIDRYAYYIGNQGFLSPMSEPMELVEEQAVYWVPNLPRHVSGVTNVHGFLVPVLDLNILFRGVPPAQFRWMLVFGLEQSAVALKLSSLPVRRRLNHAHRRPPHQCPSELAPHIRDAYPDDPAGTTRPQKEAEPTDAWLDFDHRSYFDSRSTFA